MKILIIGAAGLLGKQLVKDFSGGNEVIAADRYEDRAGLYYMDLTKKDLVKDAFERFRPELVLLPASITGVDFCEQNPDPAWAVNTEGPKLVALAAKKKRAFVVFYSSDYIFGGSAGPYTEDDKPGPINVYGKTKLEAEKIIQKELDNYLILRTCSIYGYEKNGLNYAMQVLARLGGGQEIRAVNDQFGTPTYVEDLSMVTFKLVRLKKVGIFNAVGCDYVNRVEFASRIADAFELDKGLIREIGTEELKQTAHRPKKGGLKTDKLKSEAGIVTLSLTEGLSMMKTNVTQGGIK